MTNPTDRSSSGTGAPGSPTQPGGQKPDLKDKMEEDAARTKHKVKEETEAATEQARDHARAQAESASQRGAEEADKFSSVADSVAQSLREEDLEGLASYAADASERIGQVASALRERSAEQLASDARRIARENPAAFLLGSVAVGFGLSRFFKASTPAHPTNPASTRTAEAPPAGVEGELSSMSSPASPGQAKIAQPTRGATPSGETLAEKDKDLTAKNWRND